MKTKRILHRFPLASLLLPFLMLIVAVFPIISNVHASGDASPSAKIFLCPSDYVVTEPGGTLTVEIEIADVSDLAGFELKLGYNTELLNVLEIVEG
jgi:hypothetical protein